MIIITQMAPMMLDDFLWRAILGGIGLVLITGPLGCFMVWRRMAYLGDTLAHAALLGVGLGLLLSIPPYWGVMAVCLSLAVLLVWLGQSRSLATDTLLGILAHSTLAAGMVAVTVVKSQRIDLMNYLFGDILAISSADIALIYGCVLLGLAVLWFIWQPLLLASIHQELAASEGANIMRLQLLLMLLIASVIAIAMKIVGILLVSALLIIPAATARAVANTPEQMALGAVLFGGLAVISGIAVSMVWDVATGPMIVLASTFGFVLVRLVLRRD